MGFEPTACRRGDRSTRRDRVHLCPVQFCNIVLAERLQSEWKTSHCEPEPMARHTSSPSTHQRCGDGHDQTNSRKNLLSGVPFSGCPTRNNKTSQTSVVHIGLVGFEPSASWSRTRRDTKLRYSPNYSQRKELQLFCTHVKIALVTAL